MLRVSRRVSLLALLLWVVAVPSFAEPITVTSGGTFLYWDSSATSVTLRGDGLSVGADGGGGGPSILQPGITSLDGTFIFGNFGTGVHSWRVTVDGTEYDAFLSGSLQFDAGSVVVPTGSAGDQLTLSSPFTMNGRIRGTTAALGEGTVLFDVMLTGIGTATVIAGGVAPDIFRTGGVGYEFAAATPEPATLLMMGTGLAGVLLRRRRQSHTNAG